MDTKRRVAQALETAHQTARKSARDNRVYEIKYFTATGYDYASEAADLGVEHQKDHDTDQQEQGKKPL